MLPILPALILLLLHGPSNIERMAREGRLPAALRAVRCEAAQAQPSRNQAAIAAMLTSRDPGLNQALFVLLQPDSPEPVVLNNDRPAPSPKAEECATKAPTDGFGECRRSRDGPRGIA